MTTEATTRVHLALAGGREREYEIDVDPSTLDQWDPEIPTATVRRWLDAIAEYDAVQQEMAAEYDSLMARVEAADA